MDFLDEYLDKYFSYNGRRCDICGGKVYEYADHPYSYGKGRPPEYDEVAYSNDFVLTKVDVSTGSVQVEHYVLCNECAVMCADAMFEQVVIGRPPLSIAGGMLCAEANRILTDGSSAS